MLSWFSKTDKNKKNKHHHSKSTDHDHEIKPTAPPIESNNEPLKYSYNEAYKIHIENLHQQRVTKMKQSTIYTDTIWCAVVLDWHHLNMDNNHTNLMDDNDNDNNDDILSPIDSTNIDIDLHIEERSMILIETQQTNDNQDEKERQEWMEQYRKKQELKNNLKQTVQKTTALSKYAWRKTAAFTTNATSAILSATNNVLSKIEKAKKEKELKKLQQIDEKDEKDDNKNQHDEIKQDIHKHENPLIFYNSKSNPYYQQNVNVNDETKKKNSSWSFFKHHKHKNGSNKEPVPEPGAAGHTKSKSIGQELTDYTIEKSKLFATNLWEETKKTFVDKPKTQKNRHYK